MHPFCCFQAFPPGLTLLASVPPTPLPSHLSEASGPLCQDRHHPKTSKQKTSPWCSLPQLLQVAGKTFPAAANTRDPKASCKIGSKSGQGSSNGLGQMLSESIPAGPGHSVWSLGDLLGQRAGRRLLNGCTDHYAGRQWEIVYS